MFNEKYSEFWRQFGKSKTMVLSTSLNNIVTSRMMSIVVLDGKLYFQTDKTFKKYKQLKENPNVALCTDNISIEGKCIDIGNPIDNEEFCKAYSELFTASFNQYTKLKSERLFAVTPTFIEMWVYIDKVPYIEKFDVKNKKYTSTQYFSQ